MWRKEHTRTIHTTDLFDQRENRKQHRWMIQSHCFLTDTYKAVRFNQDSTHELGKICTCFEFAFSLSYIDQGGLL